MPKGPLSCLKAHTEPLDVIRADSHLVPSRGSRCFSFNCSIDGIHCQSLRYNPSSSLSCLGVLRRHLSSDTGVWQACCHSAEVPGQSFVFEMKKERWPEFLKSQSRGHSKEVFCYSHVQYAEIMGHKNELVPGHNSRVVS